MSEAGHGLIATTGARLQRLRFGLAARTVARSRGSAALIAGALLAAAAPAFGAWIPAGPNNGRFAVLAAPSERATLYASAGDSNFWSSQDGGLTWTFAGQLPVARGYLVAVDPAQAATVYAGNDTALYRSTDGAATWTFLTAAVSFAVIAPSAPQTMYAPPAATGSSAPVGILRSSDGGATWQQAGTIPAIFSQNTTILTVSPADADTVYALGAGGFLASSDGGATWGESFSPQSAGDSALGVIVSPLAPRTLWLSYFRPAAEIGGRVYRSDDGGATWAEADAGLPPQIDGLVVAPSGTLYASATGASGSPVGIFSSSDGGLSWEQAASGLLNTSLTPAAGTPDLLFLSDLQGVQISQDQGRSWTAPSRPPSAAAIAQVLVGPAAGGSLLYAVESIDGFSAAPFSGLWESADGSASWRALAANNEFAPRLALDAQPGTLYSFSGVTAPFIPVVSRDDGATWDLLPSPAALQPLTLATDPLLPGKLVELDCGLAGTIFTGFSCTRFAVELTNTGGRGWRRLAELPHAAGSGTSPRLVRIAPGRAASPYFVLGDSLFGPSPDGQGFVVLPLRGPIEDLAVVPGTGAAPAAAPTLFAAVNRPRIFWKSGDGGAHWSPAARGLPTGVVPAALAVDPDDPATLYLATAQQIFVSQDGAASWQPLATAGVPAAFAFTALAVTPGPAKALLAGTYGGGIYLLALQ